MDAFSSGVGVEDAMAFLTLLRKNGDSRVPSAELTGFIVELSRDDSRWIQCLFAIGAWTSVSVNTLAGHFGITPDDLIQRLALKMQQP